MRSLICLFACLCLLVSFANAQQNAVSLLERAVKAGEKHYFISYNAITVDKNLFSDKDTAVNRISEFVSRNAHGKLILQNTIEADYQGRALSRRVFVNDTLFTLDLKDSVYAIQAHPLEVSGTLSDCLEKMKYVIDKKANMVRRQKDTVIRHIHCYSFFVKSYDTTENNNHNFTHLYFYLNKKTLLPVYTKELGAGSASKGGYSLGRVNAFNERHFENYRISDRYKAHKFTFDKAGFDPENQTMLQNGNAAPPIHVSNLKGEKLLPKEFDKKILLVEFGSTTCGANPLAIPLLNRLSEKYNTADVSIVGIYADETIAQIQNYITSNNIKFPIFKGSSKLKKSFKTMGTPNFYLINKSGVIVKAFDGYSDKLEQEIASGIDKLKASDGSR